MVYAVFNSCTLDTACENAFGCKLPAIDGQFSVSSAVCDKLRKELKP